MIDRKEHLFETRSIDDYKKTLFEKARKHNRAEVLRIDGQHWSNTHDFIRSDDTDICCGVRPDVHGTPAILDRKSTGRNSTVCAAPRNGCHTELRGCRQERPYDRAARCFKATHSRCRKSWRGFQCDS